MEQFIADHVEIVRDTSQHEMWKNDGFVKVNLVVAYLLRHASCAALAAGIQCVAPLQHYRTPCCQGW